MTIESGAEKSKVSPVEILIVDDREENLLALEAVLSDPDYHLVKAESGDQALRYLLEHDPALILMDVQMPHLDGFATASIIKGSPRTREIPIIFLTAIGREERFVHQGYAHGAVDYMMKPFDAHILRSKVSVFADLYRKNQSLLKAERRLREVEKMERERKIAELELKSLRREQIEQKRFRDLVNGLENGIVWTADPETMIFSFVSQPAERLLGFSLHDWTASSGFWLQQMPEEDRAIFREALERARSQGGEHEVEHRLRTAEGKVLWFRTNIRVEARAEDSSTEIRGLSLEITRAKEASRLFERSKLRSDLLAEAGLSLAESFDYQKTLPKIGKLLAGGFCDWVEIETIKDDGALEHIAVAHRESAMSREAEVRAERWLNGPARPTFPTGILPEGANWEDFSFSADHHDFLKQIDLNSAMALPLRVRGQTIGQVILAREVRREAFDEGDYELGLDLAFRIGASIDNWRLYQDAQAAIRIRDEFLSIASHELKTPLTPLKIQTQQLLRLIGRDPLQKVEPERMEKMLQTSNRQIERLSKLIDDLLDISRINTGRLQLNLESFDLMEMLNDVRQRFTSQLLSSGCDLRIVGPDSLFVRLDLFRIEQVVVNLLTNAMKYGPGQPIELVVEPLGETFALSVRDGGIGIAAEDQQRIFLRFERAVSSTHFGGLGLGLYIVTQILEAHGGRISVKSEVKKGSVFRVELPTEAAEAKPRPTANPVSMTAV